MKRKLRKPPASAPVARDAAIARAAGSFEQGLALHQAGQLEQAQDCYVQVLVMQPAHFDALHMLGVIAAQQHDSARAMSWFDQAIASNPGDAAVFINRGLALQALGRGDDARESFGRAVALRPDFPEAHYNLGNSQLACGQRDDARESFTRAVTLRPGYAEAWYNHGTTLMALAQLAAAVESFDRAIALRPEYAEAYSNRAHALAELGQLPAALASAERACALQPDYAEALWNQSLLLLLLGQYEKGWALYERRWQVEQAGSVEQFGTPLWLGAESLAGKTILLHSEQGYGDTLQFCRYAMMVQELGARVVVRAQPPLVTLLSSLAGVAQVIADGSALPPFDFHCPMLSLPLAFGTNAQNIPAIRRYLAADPQRVAHWQERLGARTLPRVGLVWSSGTQKQGLLKRNVALADLLLRLPAGCQYVSLQKDVSDDDRATLAAHAALLSLGDELQDFGDTAALCELMDLVISVDTSVAHLAGALGQRVWILLAHVPDWRWLLGRTDSPWYPTARLFRQDTVGDWTAALDAVGVALRGVLRDTLRDSSHGGAFDAAAPPQ